MKLKSTLVFTLLLAVASIPAMAEDLLPAETVQDVRIESDGTPTTPTPARQEVTPAPEFDELPSALDGARFLNDPVLSCAEIDGTSCTTSEDCGSCYPHPSCPLTPCLCGYGVCQCDMEAVD